MTTLIFDMQTAFFAGVTAKAPQVLENLGIKWAEAHPQPIFAQWKFCGCTNVPDVLPEYLTKQSAQQQEPATDAVTSAGLHASISILSHLVDQLRQLLVEVEEVFGRDGRGGPFEDGEFPLIDRVRAQIAAINPTQPQHPDNQAVDRFAVAMKEKLAKAREKGRNGWETCPPEDLSQMLREHVKKGDPRDVANFCMMLWSLGAGIAALAEQPAPVQKASIPDAWTDLTAYILQDDLHSQLTPRVVDIAYAAFMIGRSGKNKDDGGPCDWFNDTKPMVMEQLATIRKDLAAAAPQPAQPAQQEPVAWMTKDGEIFKHECWPEYEARPLVFGETSPPTQRNPLIEWQPIETAPKGPTILLYSPNPKEFSMRYSNINVAWWVSTQITEYWGTAVFFDGRSIVQHIHNPTHWMPMPATPDTHNIKEQP